MMLNDIIIFGCAKLRISLGQTDKYDDDDSGDDDNDKVAQSWC
jgi:hypothetical protein